MKAERIARVAHEVNRAYCAALGDESQLPWDEAPEWQKTSAINGARHHVEQVRDGKAAAPEYSHVLWMEEKLATGWSYGPVKDPDKKEHPCMVPYDQLPPEQRAKDHIFTAVCRELRVESCAMNELLRELRPWLERAYDEAAAKHDSCGEFYTDYGLYEVMQETKRLMERIDEELRNE